MRTVVVSPWFGATAHLVKDFARAVEGVDQVVLVDDGCDVGARRALGEISWTRIVKTDRNRGFAGACNAGYAALDTASMVGDATEASRDDVVCFLNSDVAGPPRRLAKALAREVPEGVLVGPAVGQQWVLATPFAYLDGWCVAARRSTWGKLVLPGQEGPWDAESYPGPYWEDVDLSLRATLVAGGVEPRAWRFLEHLGGASMGFAPKWGESFEKNRARFLERARPAWRQFLENAEEVPGEVARP